MKRGDLVFTKSFKAEFGDAKVRGTAGWKVPPGQLMIFIAMGSCPVEKMNDVMADNLLKDMGWTPPADDQHPDDAAIDRFAAAMKARMAQKRAEGRSGWDDPAECPINFLDSLLENTPTAQHVDIGNYAMMLFNRGDA